MYFVVACVCIIYDCVFVHADGCKHAHGWWCNSPDSLCVLCLKFLNTSDLSLAWPGA